MKKKIIIPIFMLSCMFFLTGCSKVSLTGNNSGKNSTGSAPTDNGGTPPSGNPPTDDGGTAPSDGID